MEMTLKTLKTYLTSDPKNAIGVFDPGGENRIEKGITLSQLDENHGGFYPFFENLYKKGYTKAYVYKCRYRGTVPDGQTITYEIPLTPDPKKQSNKRDVETKNLNNTIGLTGQNYVDSIIEDRDKYKRKYKKLKKEVFKESQVPQGLNGEAIVDHLKDPTLATNISMILKSIMPSPKPKENTPNELSEIKQFVIDFIKNPQITDNQASFIYEVAERFAGGDQDFTNLVVDLLKEPKNTNPN